MTQAIWQTRVDVAALAAARDRDDLRIVDARFSPPAINAPDWGREHYRQAHLPGSVYADLNRDLSAPARAGQGQGRHPLPDAAQLCQRLGQWGIGPAEQVVVYDAGDGSMAAARLWWLLRLLGHRRVAVLDGGLAAWQAAGLPQTDAPATHLPKTAYPGRFASNAIVGADEVVARLGEAPGWLLDARAGERFRGEIEPIDRRAGHIPGALNRPFTLNLDGGRLRPAEQLRAEIAPLLGRHAPEQVVLMCGSGVTACHLLLAMEVAGLTGARVYAGSWSGWIEDPAHPLASGDGT